jgi:polyisoprenoid-binding protein YceI
MRRFSASPWWLASLFGLVMPALAQAALHTSGAPEVSFTASGPAGLRIVGRTHDLVVSEQSGRIVIEVPLRRLTTGIDLRDRHMKEHLEAGRFPTVDLIVARASLRFPTSGAVSGSAHGNLRLHGQDHDVTFRYTAERSGGVIQVQGTVKVRMNRFGIEVPSYLGMTVRPDVEVSARFGLTDR